MTNFWLAITALTLLSFLFIGVPLIRFNKDRTKKGITADWFVERQKELENELNIGKFTEASYQEALTELKLRAKEELSAESEVLSKQKMAKLPLVLGLVIVLSVFSFYVVKGQHNNLKEWEEVLVKLPELSNKIINDSQQQASAEELMQFALGLRTKLAKQEDYFGWWLMGKVLFALKDVDGSLAAFEKSYKLKPTHVSTLVAYAETLQAKGEDYNIRQSLRLLQEALIIKPENELAQILLGEGYLSLGDYETAGAIFQQIDNWMTDADPRKLAVQQRLDFIANAGAPTMEIQVQVQLDSQIDLQQYAFLFVFAKSTEMPMPVAVKKIPLSSASALPELITLSDENMMLPGQKLSNYAQVEIFARLSKDDNASFAPGEWQGSQKKVELSKVTEPLNITINEESK
jgi:cytochrome c-type biogenesis protein CcmI